MKYPRFSFSSMFLLFGTMAMFALFVLRALNVISFETPRLVVTSGFEEESLYAMWKWVHGIAVYSDPYQVPYTASYFNWLFYGIYGSLIKGILAVWQLGDAWIPTVGRCITLFVVSLGCWINYRLILAINKTDSANFENKILALSLSALLWCGPLMGFWAMTVRSDALGLLFDLMAITGILLLPRKPILAVSIAIIGCYLSWACKQVNVVVPITIGLWLMWERQWRLLSVFCFGLWTAYAITLWFASPVMWDMLFLQTSALPFSFHILTINLISLFKKTLPLWILCAMMGFKLGTSTSFRHFFWYDKIIRFSLCAIVAWSLVLLPASSKVGASDNYHFILVLFLSLIVSRCITKWSKDKPVDTGFILTGMLSLVMVMVVFSRGTIALMVHQHQDLVALSDCLNHTAPPRFVANHYASLPWMNSDTPSFVLAHNYHFDRRKGIFFEEEGIGGLITKGYFNTLLLPESETTFDGAKLDKYTQQGTCVGYQILIKRDNA